MGCDDPRGNVFFGSARLGRSCWLGIGNRSLMIGHCVPERRCVIKKEGEEEERKRGRRRRGKSPYRLGPSVPPLRKRKSERRSVISFLFVYIQLLVYLERERGRKVVVGNLTMLSPVCRYKRVYMRVCVALDLVIFSFPFFSVLSLADSY
jgi:hypothetical protein